MKASHLFTSLAASVLLGTFTPAGAADLKAALTDALIKLKDNQDKCNEFSDITIRGC